ncbi:MAG: TatD family hydrolase [Desulfosalsimonadaceae bacterium]
MKIFDSHCHLNDKSYNKDMEAVIDRAARADVKKIMVVGITEETSRQAADIAAMFDGCYASVGIHPHDATSCSKTVLGNLCRMADRPEVRAWGECGLDFNRMFSPRENQEDCFVRQIEIAKELDLPLIFHERDSGGRFYELVSTRMEKGQKGVVHCFSGSGEEMEKYLDLGFHIGVTGIVTIKKRAAELRRLIKDIPEDRILVETDAPYLTPEPEKRTFRRNEPAFVRSVLMEIADIRQADPEKLASAIWNNTCRLFAIDPCRAIDLDE